MTQPPEDLGRFRCDGTYRFPDRYIRINDRVRVYSDKLASWYEAIVLNTTAERIKVRPLGGTKTKRARWVDRSKVQL